MRFVPERLRGTSEAGFGFRLSLYLSTLILGAGVFLLPLEAAQIGWVPLLAMLLVVLWPCTRLYDRVAALMVRRDDESSGGGEALMRAVVEAGAGKAGAALSLIGIAVYVFGAAILYVQLGTSSIEQLANQLAPDAQAASALAGASLVVAAVAWKAVPPKSAVARRLLLLLAVWGLAASVVGFAGHQKLWTTVVGLAGFTAGCLFVAIRPAAPAVRPIGSRLTADHSSSIVGLVIQLGLMAAAACIAVVAVVACGPAKFHWNSALPASGTDLTALLGPGAVVLFAHVGTGMSSIGRYPAMASAHLRRRTVRDSLLIVTAVLAVWLVVTAVLFGHAGLLGLAKGETNSALGLGSLAKLTSVGGVLSVLGALVTLIAVTNANAGFVTSLANESVGALQEIRPRNVPGATSLTTWLLAILTVVAGIMIAKDASLRPMLHTAGIVGGGVIVVVLPLLAEDSSSIGRRTRAAAAAVIAVCVLGVWATMAALTSEDVGAVMRAVMVGAGWLPLIPTVLAAVGVRRGGRLHQAAHRPSSAAVDIALASLSAASAEGTATATKGAVPATSQPPAGNDSLPIFIRRGPVRDEEITPDPTTRTIR